MKIFLHVVVSALCAVTLCGTALAYDSSELQAAEALFNLGLMKGNSASFSPESMNLDSVATRAELAVTVTRMLGRENKALYQNNTHPFADVPDWANAHVGWLYENYLVNGVSDTLFGSEEPASVKQFCAMLSRVLGYSEAEGDFSYDDAVKFAVSLGFADSDTDENGALLRGAMAKMCFDALHVPKKLSVYTLAKNLAEQKVLSQEALQANSLGTAGDTQGSLERYFASTKETLGEIYLSRDNSRIYVHFVTPVTEYGLRVFYTSDACPTVTELPLNGETRGFQKGKISYPNGSVEGFVDQLELYGLSGDTGLRFTIVRATSEEKSFKMTGRSAFFSASPESFVNAETVLEKTFEDVPNTLGELRVVRDDARVFVNFAAPVEEYGLHVYYISDTHPVLSELPLNGTQKGFFKGQISYTSDSAAGFLDNLELYRLPIHENGLRVIVIKGSSEGELFTILGRSGSVPVK